MTASRNGRTSTTISPGGQVDESDPVTIHLPSGGTGSRVAHRWFAARRPHLSTRSGRHSMTSQRDGLKTDPTNVERSNLTVGLLERSPFLCRCHHPASRRQLSLQDFRTRKSQVLRVLPQDQRLATQEFITLRHAELPAHSIPTETSTQMCSAATASALPQAHGQPELIEAFCNLTDEGLLICAGKSANVRWARNPSSNILTDDQPAYVGPTIRPYHGAHHIHDYCQQEFAFQS